MKIGILTYYRAFNYGAFLLSFAMKKTVEGLGGDCYFLDVQKGEKTRGSKLNLMLRYCAFLEVAFRMAFSGQIYNLIRSIKYKNARDKAFETYYKILETEKIDKGEFDLVIIGSDEVFNATGHSDHGFTTQLLGDVKNSKKVISYAASCGPTTIKKIQKFGLEDKMREAMANFHAISVRDQNTHDVVGKIACRKAEIHIDPVFLFDFKDYLTPKFANKDYILLYSFQYKISRREQREIIKYAKNRNKKIISIGCCYDWCDKSLLPETPFEVLDYVKNASAVITDTFHGLVFSIKFNKNFCALQRPNNKEKIGYLLKQFNLENWNAGHAGDISKLLDTKPDYSRINQFIVRETERSINYLSNYIMES